MEAGARFQQETPKDVPTHPAHEAFKGVPRIGSGWVAFAGTYMAIAGMLNLIWGVTALSKKDYFVDGGLVWSSLGTWGWIAVLIAVAQCLTAALLLARRIGGVLLAIVITMCAMLVNFATFGAYP